MPRGNAGPSSLAAYQINNSASNTTSSTNERAVALQQLGHSTSQKKHAVYNTRMTLPHSHTAAPTTKESHDRHFSFAQRAVAVHQQDDANSRKLYDYQRQLSEHTRRLEQRKVDMMNDSIASKSTGKNAHLAQVFSNHQSAFVNHAATSPGGKGTTLQSLKLQYQAAAGPNNAVSSTLPQQSHGGGKIFATPMPHDKMKLLNQQAVIQGINS